MAGEALKAAIAHLKSLGRPHFDVPEWQVPAEGTEQDGKPKTKPLRIHYAPLTIVEREQILAADNSDVSIMIARAKDENGNPLFSVEDEPVLRRAASFHVINRIATVLFALPSLTVEGAAKN